MVYHQQHSNILLTYSCKRGTNRLIQERLLVHQRLEPQQVIYPEPTLAQHCNFPTSCTIIIHSKAMYRYNVLAFHRDAIMFLIHLQMHSAIAS